MKKLIISIFIVITVSIFNPAASAQIIPTINDTAITEFGIYTPYSVSVTPQVTPYTIQPGLTNVAIAPALHLTDQAKEKLVLNGFVVGSGKVLQMYDLYYQAQNDKIPLFITSDAVLHTFHILYDYTLRMLEVNEFYDDVNILTDLLLAKANEYLEGETDTQIQEVLTKNLAFLYVAKILFDKRFDPGPGVPAVVDSLISAELNHIYTTQTIMPSPIFGYEEDYSQYIPRGHYTRNETLQQYFQGMMWYGRMMFRLKPNEDDKVNAEGKKETLQALYLIKALMESQIDNEEAKDLWKKVYYPTVFFVGKTDDLSFDDYLPVIQEVYGKSITSLSLTELASEASLGDFVERALTLRNPLINSSVVDDWEDFQTVTKGFHLMGQRFIPDSYMFHKLTHSDVSGRLFPKGLDVFAVLGSEEAQSILVDYYNQAANYPDYLPAIAELKDFFSNHEEQAWAQNLYWNWLYTLDPLLWVKGNGYPFFMRNTAWLKKDLYTALGSWAELRHDTILYAKQSYTERVSIITVDPTKGYVEPNPHLFARLAALANFMRDGLTSKDLALDIFDRKLRDFEDLLISLKTIAEKELVNLTPTDEEYNLILSFPGKIEELNSFPPEISGQIANDTDEKMAVIADVHTDVNSMQVLEEGVGYPLPIYVVCSIGQNLVVTQGAIFSYYEFTHPLNDRLNDEAWQVMLTHDPSPEKPGWTDSFRDVTLNEYTGEYRHTQKGEIITGVEEPHDPQTQLPSTMLMQNAPNPANPQTTIRYFLAPGGTHHVTLTIFNIMGQVVRQLVNAYQQGDKLYTAVWDGKDNHSIKVSSGIYFYNLKTNSGFTKTRKMLFIK